MIAWLQREWKLMVILMLYLALAVAHTVILPLGRGEDEYANFRYIQFIAEHSRLPINYEERVEARYKSDWPALYHLTIAALTGWANHDGPPQLKPMSEEPRRKLIKEILRPIWLLHTEDEQWPYQGEILMWRLGRLATNFIGLGTLLVTYFVILEIFPGRKNLALRVVAFWAVMPRFLFTNAVLSEDGLLGLMMTVFLYLLVKIVKGQAGLWLYLALGLVTGLAITAKYSAVLAPIEIGLIFTLLALRRGWGWQTWFVRSGLTAMAAIVAAAWWFAFIEWHFNEIDELGLFAGLVKPVLAGGIDPSMQKAAVFVTAGTIAPSVPTETTVYRPLLGLALDFVKTFWSGQVVEQFKDHLFEPYLHLVITGVALLAGVGLWRIWQANKRDNRTWIGLLALHASIIGPIIILRFLTQNDPGWAAQGRHLLFPAVPAIGLLLAWGWSALPPVLGQLKITSLIIGVLLVWSVAAQLVFPLTVYPTQAPVRTTPAALNQVSQPLQVRFGQVIELIGYEANLHSFPASLELTLLWQALDFSSEDYLIEIKLIDAAGQVQRQLVRQFGDGIYPSRVWDVGDIVRDDIGLPLIDLSPGTYQLQLSLLSADGPLGSDKGNPVRLTTLEVGELSSQSPSRKLTVSLAQTEIFYGFDVWRNASIVLGKPEYSYGASIPIAGYGQAPTGVEIRLQLVSPTGRAWAPERTTGPLSVFMVGPGWESGEYILRVEVWRNGELVSTTDSGAILMVRNKARLVDLPTMTHQVEANFANRVILLGYDLVSRRTEAGRGISLVLYWRGLRTMTQNFVFFTDLVDQNQRSWGKLERTPRDNHPTLLWAPGEIVVDAYEVPIDANVLNGVYHLKVGLYLPVGESPVLLPLVQNNRMSNVSSVDLGPIKVGRAPAGVVLTPAEIRPQTALSINLGQPSVIALRGYDVAPAAGSLQLTLYWESLAPTPLDWTTFVHLRNEAGETVAQQDGPTGSGLYSTSLWDAGEIIADKIMLPVNNLSNSHYNLAVGLYDLASGTRLAVPNNPANELLLNEKIVLP